MGVFFGNLSVFAIVCLLFLPVWFALIAATTFNYKDDSRPTFKSGTLGLVVFVISFLIESVLLHNPWNYSSHWYHVGVNAHSAGVVVGWLVTPLIASRYSYKLFVYGDKANRRFRKGEKYRSSRMGFVLAAGIGFGLFGIEIFMDFLNAGLLDSSLYFGN